MKQTYHTENGENMDFASPGAGENPDRSGEKEEWNVFFDGGFRGVHGRDRAGKEISVQKEFTWGGHFWIVPSVYVCDQGLAVDFCMKAETSQVRLFMEKWGLDPEHETDREFSREQRMLLERENPLHMEFRAAARLNGKSLQAVHGSKIVYFPGRPEHGAQGRKAAEHYGLDLKNGWVISRFCYPWPDGQKPETGTLAVTMTQMKVPVPGPRFRTDRLGDACSFIWPGDGKEYVLTVEKHENQVLDVSGLPQEGMEYPVHYIAMDFMVSPELPDGAMTLTDCADGDRPRRMPGAAGREGSVSGAAAIGIIGGADGLGVIAEERKGKGQKRLHTVFSSLHFEPADYVEWRMIFHEKKYGDITVSLITGTDDT